MSKPISVSTMSWGQRFAIAEAYHPDDEQICKVFQVSKEDLDHARQLRKDNVIKIDSTLNTAPYGVLFGKDPVTSKSVTTHGPATKKVAEPKKRGRKGDKILNAFKAIGKDPVSAEEFITTHGISMAVLRQSRRFDSTEVAATNPVRVRKNDKGVLMVWRDEPSAEAAGEEAKA